MSHTSSADPDELLDDTAEQPAARGPRRRTVSEGPAAGHEVLNNPGSARISRVAGLSRRNARTKHRRFLVEGPQGVREAVRHAPDRVLDVYLTEAAVERHAEIWQEAVAAQLYVHVTSEQVMDAMSTDAQGILAVVATEEAAGSEALAAALDGARLVAVLTQAQDPGNAGTIIRAADAAGADGRQRRRPRRSPLSGHAWPPGSRRCPGRARRRRPSRTARWPRRRRRGAGCRPRSRSR